jgi:multidrug efflux system outer membrane protein
MQSSRSLRILPLAVALALSGCAMHFGPAPVVKADPAMTVMPRIAAPAASTMMAPQLSIERWWLMLGDAELNRLMDEALARNEDLESAVAKVREAQAQLDEAGAAQSPTLDAQGRNRRALDSNAGTNPLPPGFKRQTDSRRFELTAGYEIDLWGKLSSMTEAARQQYLAAEWARAAVEWGITARVAEAYYKLAAVDRQIAINGSVRDSRLATMKLRQREHGAGAGNEFDLRRAEAELTGTDGSLASLTQQRNALERSLIVLLGRSPSEIIGKSIVRNPLNEARAFTAVLPQGATDELLTRRPDVKQAEAQLAAANANIEAARAATLPAAKLSGSLGSDAATIANLFTSPAGLWSIVAGISSSIFDGGKGKARVKEEQARAEQSLANYRKVVAGAVLDVREAYGNLDATQQGLEAQGQRVQALARASELARLGYKNGASNYLDLLDAERSWHAAQMDQVSFYRDRLLGQVAAFKALGGGFAPVRIAAN